MKWIEAAITTRSEEIDALCEKLGAYDIGGICIEDEADFKRFLENNHQYWDYVDAALAAHYDGLSRVKFYVEDSDAGRALLEKIKAELGCEVATSTVDDADWENSWQQYYEPLEIGEKLLVVPEWLDAEPNGRTVLRLDPGIAFGTGSHPTTRMCLEALERFAAPGKTALELTLHVKNALRLGLTASGTAQRYSGTVVTVPPADAAVYTLDELAVPLGGAGDILTEISGAIAPITGK